MGDLFGLGGDPSKVGDIGAGGFEQGEQTSRAFLQKALAGLGPFQKTGGQAFQSEFGQLQQEADPTAFVNNILSQFQQSPAQKFAQQQGIQASRNQLEAAGLGGSGAGAQALQQQGSDIAGQQQQQFLQNVLGVRQQTLGGLGQLGGMGLQSALAGGQFNMQTGEDIASEQARAAQARAAAEQASQQQQSGGIGSLIGGGISLLGGLL